jgi:hypothetical protein
VTVSRGCALALMLLACGRSVTPRTTTDAGAPDLLAGVVDPWTWPRAQGATARERAIEDIGPWEPVDPRDPRSPPVNVNGHHWTVLAGLAWDRDIVIELDREPVDLDDDDVPDTRVTRRVVARGGILANPALFGLEPTPEDPRGTVGRVQACWGCARRSIATGGAPASSG